MKIKTSLDTIKSNQNLITKTELMLRANIQKRKMYVYKVFSLAACFMFICGVLFVAAYIYYQHPVNYIDIDINSSLELGVNSFNRVVNVTYFNNAAENLIDKENLEGCEPEEAVALVIQAARDKGYFPQKAVSVISLAACGSNEEETEILLCNCADFVSTRYENLAVYSVALSNALKKEAVSVSMSTGKLHLIQMIQMLDETATVDEFQNYPVSAIFERLAYLASDTNTNVPENSKQNVTNAIRAFTAQMQCIRQHQDETLGEKIETQTQTRNNHSYGNQANADTVGQTHSVRGSSSVGRKQS
ncbi:MAG: hypothetical protein EOM23_05315 [Candidatus Moranbacteria bacterium]|nr:hypothetical protein [Candidatus Moranbacteria bacterium]